MSRRYPVALIFVLLAACGVPVTGPDGSDGQASDVRDAGGDSQTSDTATDSGADVLADAIGDAGADVATDVTGDVAADVPTDAVAPLRVLRISAGGAHTCALLSDGTARCWGSNDRGQVGPMTSASVLRPYTIDGPRSPTAIAAGGQHSCLLDGSGIGWCWGSDAGGQLGDWTDTTPRGVPRGVRNTRNVPVTESFVSISASVANTLMATADGRLFAWGSRADGQLGVASATNLEGAEPFSGGTPAAFGGTSVCAWAADAPSRLYCLGSTLVGVDLRRPTAPLQIAVARGRVCLRDATEVQCLARPADTWETIPSLAGASTIAVSTTGVCGIVAGALRCTMPAPSVVADATDVSAGGQHWCVVQGGQALCWGANASGQLGDGTTTDAPDGVFVTF